MDRSAAFGVVRAFNWAQNTLRCLLQVLGIPALQDSLLTQTGGSDSDFSGGAGGWEVASDMISAACAEIPELSADNLQVCSVTDS